MEKTAGEIQLYASDPEINGLIRRKSENPCTYGRHFNQSEDFFLRLRREFEVPSFQIHHNINTKEPDREYLTALRSFVATIQPMVPGLFEGLTYYFDPAEVLRPSFYQLYRVSGEFYLYTLKIDLVFRPQTHVVVQKGSNDRTPVYRTANLIVEPTFLPLRDLERDGDRLLSFVVDQLISDTWIGETGRGYFVQGIWIDSDLNKFFSRLVIPEGKRIYPYYPFTSKYRTVCHVPVNLEPSGRREAVPLLHRLRTFLVPHLDDIQAVLRAEEFSPEIALFQELRQKIPADWSRFLETFSLDVYLNDAEMREFEIVEA